MQEGDLIAGRYRLQARAGAGAMGVVFRATDVAEANCAVAVKTWRKDAGASADRFRREASALATLRGPSLVRYVDHGVSEQGEPYLVMEWIEGPTLAERLAGAGLTPLETLHLAERVLAGLETLHAAGVVHRDLKPSNLMLPRNEVSAVRILDLGIARLAQESIDLTAEGAQLGTPRYMAPEQIRDPRRVDGRADVFALGCVVFECLVGMPAFPGDEPLNVLAQILFGRCPDVSELRPELPEQLDALLGSLLTRRPELRPAAAAARAEITGLLAEPLLARLSRLSAMPHLPPRTAAMLTELAVQTLPEISAERPSVPLLFARVGPATPVLLSEEPTQPLLGRERELTQVRAWLQEAQPILLWGAAGVGKTRLALELARLARARGVVADSAVLFCDLTPARDSGDVVRICAEQLGMSIVGQADPEDFLGHMLSKFGALLIVLDRAEHLGRDLPPLIQLWTRRAPGLRLLVTSRVRLRVARECALGPLEHRPVSASASRPPPLQPSAAGGLVLALARQFGADAVDDSANLVHAEAIASALEGNPLAIELALARLPLLGFAGILERLSRPLGLLGERGSAVSMRSALEWSWQLLGPAERAAFAQSSVFCGAFTLRAAERVIALPGQVSVLETMQALREHSLIGLRGEGLPHGAARLSMAAVLRDYARQQLELSADIELTRERHARYCLEQAQERDLPAEVDPADLIAALEYSLNEPQRSLPRALSLLLALSRQLLAAGPVGRLAALLETALTTSADGLEAADPELARLTAKALQLRARLLAPSGELARARADLERVLAAAKRLADPALSGSALLDLGVVAHFGRDLAAASGYYHAGLEALADADDLVAEARCHGNLGALSHDQGQLGAAREGYRRALALLPEHGQERLRANFQGNLALVEHELGRAGEARRLYLEAIAGLELLLDARLLGIVLGNFATLELSQGDIASARQHQARAHGLLAQSGDRRSEALSLARWSAALALDDQIPEAEQRMARAERLVRKDPLGRAVITLLSAFIDLATAEQARQENQTQTAQAALERAQEKHRTAHQTSLGGIPVYQQSDDLRLYDQLLQARLQQLRSDPA
jgi:serine/threonine protein kinase/tetratricopeptide (TPR) repeat protein